MGAFADFINRVGDGNRQSCAARHGQVGQVVADVSDLFVGEAFGVPDLFVDGGFVVNALMQVVNLQFVGSGGEARSLMMSSFKLPDRIYCSACNLT